jgi:Na+/pantothenate symporter
MTLLAKRINQVARKTGAITIPDVLRDRYESPGFGTLATAIIVVSMIFNLIAQFKGGAVILQSLVRDVPLFQSARHSTSSVLESTSWTAGIEPGYLLCLLVFALVVVIYTSYGGFRAVVWTDVLQGFVMLGGVIIMLPLAIWAAGGLSAVTSDMQQMKPPMEATVAIDPADGLDSAMTIPKGAWLSVDDQFTRDNRLYYRLGESVKVGPGDATVKAAAFEFTFDEKQAAKLPAPVELPIQVKVHAVTEYQAPTNGGYTSGPGWDPKTDAGYLPLSLAISFFFFWTFSNAGQPSNMVRLMSFKDSRTLKHAIFTVSIYYTLIYFPLVLNFCCARVVLPGWEVEADRIMPEMARTVTESAGFPWLAGLVVAAPFAAVMSTMDSFLLMISSAIVRDIYQRNINPDASERTIKRMTYVVTFVVGGLAMCAAIYPPKYLQDLIVFTGSMLSSSFLAPMALSLYWPRCTKRGAMNGMLMGFGSLVMLYAVGYYLTGELKPYYILGFHPFMIGLGFSLSTTFFGSLSSDPPPEHLVRKFFYR